jgi:hypothetical protein
MMRAGELHALADGPIHRTAQPPGRLGIATIA